MEVEIERKRITDPVVNLRGAGKDISGRCRIFTGSWIRSILRLIEVEGAGHPSGP